MGKFRLFLLGAVSFFLSQTAFSQEQLGIRLDNYTGMDQAWLNPAFVAASPLAFDIHLGGLGVYGENNYAFIRNTSILDMAKNSGNFMSAFDLDGAPAPKGSLVGDVYDSPNKKFLKFATTFTGPSLMFKVAEKHSVGVFTNMRAAFSVTNIPEVLGFGEYDRKKYGESFEVSPFEAAGAIWNETGIHYGFDIEKSNGHISFGANLKYNSFLESGFIGIQDKLTVTKISKDSTLVNNPAVEFAITTGNLGRINFDTNNKSIDLGNPSLDFYGHGVSADVGASIQIEDNEVEGYRWRAGFSVLDFGLINIKKKAEFHTSSPIPAEVMFTLEDLQDAKNLKELEQTISNNALGNPNASLKAKTFKMGLPTAISLQGDYQFIQNVYVGGALVQPFGLSRYNLTRTAILAVSPRFENRYFSLSTPIVLRDWKSPRMGLAGRLGFLSFGTDNIGSFIRKKDFTGTDFYFSLSLNAINLPKFLSGGRKRGRSSLGCYGF